MLVVLYFLPSTHFADYKGCQLHLWGSLAMTSTLDLRSNPFGIKTEIPPPLPKCCNTSSELSQLTNMSCWLSSAWLRKICPKDFLAH